MKTALLAAAVALLAPAAALAQTDGAPAAANAHFTLDTPIKDLIADPQAKAVLDKDLPGMSSDENLPKFEDKSLRQLQPLTGGQLTDDLLGKVATDLATTGGDAAPADAAPAGDDSAPDDSPTTAVPAPTGDASVPQGR